MKTLHFETKQYNEDYTTLALVDEDDNIISSTELANYAWEANENNFQDYWKNELISGIHTKIEHETYKPIYRLPEDIYQQWFKHYYYINGEDASAYIKALGCTQHTTNFTRNYGIQLGWKYFKILKAHGFKNSTAATLAFSRGILGAMDANSPWEKEGTEALDCLGLQVLDGTELTD